MATSLAKQLQRLATPQASALVESNKRASILFDSKEAATKNSEIIYDIGVSGLNELITLNPVFHQFQYTLFDRTTIDFERSVEKGNVNETLNKNIKKFLLQLSPYFLRQPDHKCLEWLIRRYRINEHNIDDMMALILPYHETMMFVKCVQTMSLKDDNNPWHWFQRIQKPGVPMSKQTILNRAASDPFFLKFISKTTKAAVEELDIKAYTLQALFAFYSTVTLGALDVAPKITNSHVSNIAGTLVYGLSSTVPDFCAASMIIIGFLVTKLELQKEVLKRIIEKLANISHPQLKKEALVLLVVVYQTQNESTNLVNETLLAKMIDNTSLATLIGSIYEKNINVLSLCLPMITACLDNVHKQRKTKQSKKFVETLLSQLFLNNDDANAMIRCILNAMKEISEVSSDVIEVDSDDDGDVVMVGDNLEENQWHSSILRNLETRYPIVFDAVKRDIMSNQDEDTSNNRKSLKTVLGTLLCTAYNADPSAATIFVDLYHPSATNRIQAVKVLVNNLSIMPFTDDKKNLLVAGIVERLNDTSPDVVTEVLKFKTEDLIKIAGEQNLIRKLKVIVGDAFVIKDQWQNAISSAINHLTSRELLSDNNEVEIFLVLWPYMFPYTTNMVSHTKQILNSNIADRFLIIKRLVQFKFQDGNNDPLEFDQFVQQQMESFVGMSKINQIIQFVKTIPDVEMTKVLAFHIINLLTYSLSSNSDHKLAAEVLEIVSRFSEQFQLNTNANIDNDVQIVYRINSSDGLPIQVVVKCIQAIIEKTNFSAIVNSTVIDFTNRTDELMLVLKIYENLCTSLYSSSKKVARSYNKVILEFFDSVLPNIEKQLDFFSNFFINHYIEQLPDTPNWLDPTLQLRSMRLFNELLTQTDRLSDITMEVFIRIISGLTSPYEAVRITTCDTIALLYELLDQSSQYSKVFGLLLNYKERFLLNSKELSVSMFHMKIKNLRTQLFEFIRRPESAMILKASVLNMLGLINNIEYLNIVVDAALDILNKADSVQQVVLNPLESIVVHETIIRFTSDTIKSILTPGNCRNFFKKALQQSNVFVQIDNKLQSIAVVAMYLNIFNNFNDLQNSQQKFIIESIVKSATFSECNEVRSRAGRLFQKTIQMDGKVELNILTDMAKVTIRTSNDDVQQRKLRQSFSPELLHTPEWKCGVTLLEFLHKKGLKNPRGLMQQLFPVLQKCLDFDEQSMVEYVKQIVLGDILNCCELMSPNEKIPESDFKIELIVQCIRGTQNPQTHHHALQLLTKLATMIPESVLHNVMDIFTFVGYSVARREDTYIYQLISNIIKSVVPILKENNVIQVLKVFTDVILDVPTHRRAPLYEDLLKTLDPVKYLWMFLAILFEPELRRTDSTKLPNLKRTLIATEITNLFDCDVIMETCSELIKFLSLQLNVKDKKISAIDDNLKSIFNVKLYTDNQYVLYKNLIFHFIRVLTRENSEFSKKMSSLEKTSLIEYKNHFKNIIPAILDYIKASAASHSNIRADKIWGDSMTDCYYVLDHLLELLYSDMLLQVVNTLLSEENEAEVRIKIIDLLNKKLDSPELFSDCDDSIISLLGPLMNIVKSITNSDKLMEAATPKQNIMLQKDALVAIQLMSRILAKTHHSKFADVLKVLSKILHSYKEISIAMQAYLVECIGEVCANLRVNAISHLHSFMPLITEVLDNLISLEISATSPCFVVILKAIHRIVETIPLFLSPYLVKLIAGLSILWSRLQITSSNDSQNSLLNLNGIWQVLSSALELRVLIPMIEKNIYPHLVQQKKFDAVGPLMILLLDSFGHRESADLAQNSSDLTTFFIDVLDFRATFHDECKTVDVQEDFIIKTFVGLVLKLSEGSFRPLYVKLHEWACENNGYSYDRAVTFYRLTSKVAESLKSLFKTFARPIVQHSADLLKKSFTNDEINASSTTPVNLIENILQTLNTVFLYCNGFVNQERFDILMEPLVNLLDNETYLRDKKIEDILPKCLAQFAVAANNDVLWKQLNYQILLKTRSNSVAVRRAALICSVEVVIKLGDDFTQLLPETIPFYAELMEDDNTEIETQCHKSIREIEKVLNEPLQKYF